MSYEFGSLDPDERIPLHVEGEGPGRRPLLASALVMLVMAVFAGGLWLAYRAGAGHGEGGVPLIRAESTPAKVRPSSPGGLEIPDQNMLIYNEGEPRVERLLPGPEEPMPRPVGQPSPAAAAPAKAAPALPTASAAPSPAAQKEPPLQPAGGRAPAPSAARSPAAPAGTRIQLGALKSEAAARAEWERLQRANPQILGALSALTVRSDLGEKGVFYRIEAGPFASPAEAAKVCGELKRKKIGCLLVR